jgi:AcrR family transcriptional regulator
MVRPRQVSDEEILTAAREAIFEAGTSVSTTVIADRVGLSQAALFKRFGTKASIVKRALGVPDRPPWCVLLEGGPDGRALDAQLIEVGGVMLAFLTKMVPRLISLRAFGLQMDKMFGDVATSPPVLGKQAIAAWFAQAMDEGRMRCSDPGVLAMSFLGMFQARAFWRHVVGQQPGDTSDDDYVRQVVESFWCGNAVEEQA